MERALIALLALAAPAAELVLPPSADAAGWERALSEVCTTVPGDLTDIRVRWVRAGEGWTLHLEHGALRAAISGLTPGETHAQRVEQLYVALARLGTPATPSLAERLAPPPPPAAVRSPEPEPVVRISVPAAVPPPPPAEPTAVVVLRPDLPDDGPPAPIPREVGPSATLLAAADFGGGVGAALQSQARTRRISAGGRLAVARDADVTARGGTSLPVTARVTGTRADALLLAEAPVGRGFRIAARSGVSWRRYAVPGRRIGGGLVPVVALVGAAEVRVAGIHARPELAWTHDLRSVMLTQGFQRVPLVADRIEVGVGFTVGGR